MDIQPLSVSVEYDLDKWITRAQEWMFMYGSLDNIEQTKICDLNRELLVHLETKPRLSSKGTLQFEISSKVISCFYNNELVLKIRYTNLAKLALAISRRCKLLPLIAKYQELPNVVLYLAIQIELSRLVMKALDKIIEES